MSNDLVGRVALVTGSSRGLGAAIARKLGQNGAKVAINYYRSGEESAKKVRDSIVVEGGCCEVFKADITDEAEVTKMCRDIEKIWKGIDILVVNATGPQPTIRIEDLTWEDMLQQLNFFVKSPLLLVKQVIKSMKIKKYGRIINIGSEVFELGCPENSHYVSAKGAQLGLTRSWSKELAPFDITVNMVAPGWIPTERHAGEPEETKREYAKNVPMNHMGDTNDIAEAVDFLASDREKFITGQRISVNGGNTMV